MGPRRSRRQALVHLPVAKTIFDVDEFIADQRRLNALPLPINAISTGKRSHHESSQVSELEVHFWVNLEDREPYFTQVVLLPSWWTAKMYLAALFQSYAIHECIGIRTQCFQSGSVRPPFRSISIVSSLFSCSEQQLNESLRIPMHSVEGGSMI
jgi:hypothetical protein